MARWQSLADCSGLENRRTATYRGFKSLSRRHPLPVFHAFSLFPKKTGLS